MTTIRCKHCQRKFNPSTPRLYPEFPGYCDEHAALMAEDNLDVWGEKISSLKATGDSFFVPITPEDPRPWETLEAEKARPRWANTRLVIIPLTNGARVYREDFFDKEAWVQQRLSDLKTNILSTVLASVDVDKQVAPAKDIGTLLGIIKPIA